MAEKNSTMTKTEELCIRLATNLTKLKSAMGWNQKEFADKWMVSTGALNNYINVKSDTLRLPSLDLLIDLCGLPDFEKVGLKFSIDDLLNESFDPEATIRFRRGISNGGNSYIDHNDFIGNYLCYFNDQADIADEQGNKHHRELRYGVISIFDDIDGVTAKRTMRVIATFYKSSDSRKAILLKKSLDDILSSTSTDTETQTANGERNKKIIELMSNNAGLYTGELTFSGQFAFIDIVSEVYNDKALMILYIPPKNTTTNYIGGIGSIASVSHGRKHMPSAQKIIISKVELKCSEQDITPHLNMSYPNLSHVKDGQDIGKLCDKLYNDDYDYLNREDKIAVIQNRVNKIIKDYIKDNLCCASTVSEIEDAQIYRLISASMKE